MSFWPYIAANMPAILKGLLYSLKLFAIVAVIVLPLSTLVAIAAVHGPKWFKAFYRCYNWLFRGSR